MTNPITRTLWVLKIEEIKNAILTYLANEREQEHYSNVTNVEFANRLARKVVAIYGHRCCIQVTISRIMFGYNFSHVPPTPGGSVYTCRKKKLQFRLLQLYEDLTNSTLYEIVDDTPTLYNLALYVGQHVRL